MPLTRRTCTGVVFATPLSRPWVSLEYDQSLAATCWGLGRLGIRYEAIKLSGEDHAQARNKLLTTFLEDHPTASDLMWIDDDIGWDPQRLVDWLTRPEDIIAGAYRLKEADDEIGFPIGIATEHGRMIEQDGLIGADSVAGGFIRMRRHVAEMLAANADKFWRVDPRTGARKEWFNVFEMGRGPDGRWWGEDFAMCCKWRALGGEIWIDPLMPLTHRGEKTWDATLADHLHLYHGQAARETDPQKLQNLRLRHALDRIAAGNAA
jgi:hypothetical protein